MLGVLGLGTHSTAHFVKRLNEIYNFENGGFSTCPFVMLNVDFNLINPYLPNNFTELIPVVENQLKRLKGLGVTRIVVPNITVHETIDQLDESIQSMIIHPLKLVEKLLISSSKEKVLILGTNYTMKSNYVRSYFSNLEAIVLNDDLLSKIDDIRKNVYDNGSSQSLIEELISIVDIIIDETVVVVVACTELSLISPKNTGWLDLLELQLLESTH